MSVQDNEKIFPFLGAIFRTLDGRSSSVFGGVSGSFCPSLGIRPSFGILILPFGVLLALMKRPAGFLMGTLGLGLVGAWIRDICVMMAVRLGG